MPWRWKVFPRDCLAILFNYDFPGNVRELKNLLEAIFVNEPSRIVTCQDLPSLFRQRLKETENLPKDERARLLARSLYHELEQEPGGP